MSSLLKRTMTLARPQAGRTWLIALVAVGLLTTALSLASAGQARQASTTALASAARQAPAQGAGSATPAGHAMPMSSTGTATTKTVEIKNYAYSPASLTINVGDTVTWTNMDTAPHTVTVTNGPVKFSSGNLGHGESFSYTFKVVGTYSYYCAVHPDMVASVTVVGSSSPPSPTPTTEPTTEPTPDPPMPAPSACGGLEAAVDAFMAHFYAAHLETSPGQQLADALDADQYTKTHTVLLGHMLRPVLGGADTALDVFMQHVYAAHLEASPGQQAQDALDFDQYVKTHTVMIEHMIKPLAGHDVSDC